MVGVHSIHLPIITEGFPGGSDGKESTCNEGDLGSIPGLRRSPGEGDGYPLQYSGLENSMDCIVHGVTKSQTRLSNFHWQMRAGGLSDKDQIQARVGLWCGIIPGDLE